MGRMMSQFGQARPERMIAKTSLPGEEVIRRKEEKGCFLLRLNPEATEVIAEKYQLILRETEF